MIIGTWMGAGSIHMIACCNNMGGYDDGMHVAATIRMICSRCGREYSHNVIFVYSSFQNHTGNHCSSPKVQGICTSWWYILLMKSEEKTRNHACSQICVEKETIICRHHNVSERVY